MPSGLVDVAFGVVLTAMVGTIGWFCRAAFLRIEREIVQVNITLDDVPSTVHQLALRVAKVEQWTKDHERWHVLGR